MGDTEGKSSKGKMGYGLYGEINRGRKGKTGYGEGKS